MNRLSSNRLLISDAIGTTLIRCLGLAMAFSATMLSARVLGPTELGSYAAGISLAVLLATIAPLGTERVLMRSLSINTSHQSAGCDIAGTHVTALASCGAMLTSLAVIAGTLAWIRPESVWPRTLLHCALALVPQTLVYLRQWMAIPIIGTRRAVAPEQMLLPALFAGSLAAVAATGMNANATLAAVLYAGTLTIILLNSLRQPELRQFYTAAWRMLPACRPRIGAQIRNGLPFLTVAMGAVWTQSCVPLVVALACGLRESVFLSLALPFATLAVVPLGVINLSLMPQFSRFHHAQDVPGATRLARSTATVTLLLAVSASILIWLGSPMIPWLLGPDYWPVRPLLPALLLAGIADALTGPTFPIMQTMSLQHEYSRLIVRYCPIQFLLIVGLGQWAGVDGTAIAYFVSRCVWNVMIWRSIHRHLGISMLPVLPSRMRRLDGQHANVDLTENNRDTACDPPRSRSEHDQPEQHLQAA